MKGNYFVKYEEIHKGEKAMIIMDIKINNLYAFKNFHMNMSYPKKIVGSSIAGEYLENRPNFRYKKVNIIMGGNATGKTSLGKILMRFTNYFDNGNYNLFTEIIDERDKEASLVVDFVTDADRLYRFKMHILPCGSDKYTDEDVDIRLFYTVINQKDNYETCVGRLNEGDFQNIAYEDIEIETRGWHFSYPYDSWKKTGSYLIEDDENYLYILEQIMKTLDPSIREVIKLKELDNTYAIKLKNHSVIIQEGKISNGRLLSSGTKAGIDISYIIASLVCDKHDLYYCDELFSYINSDIEKACLSIMIEKLTDRKQLFFTTHNTDVLDMQLPKHSFTFLKKDVEDINMPIKCVYAGNFLKRNTDSLKHAVENDLFCTVPELHRLYEIADL